MEERRRAKRLKEQNEITITVVSGTRRLPRQKLLYGCSKDISSSGAKIRANILLPVDTILKIDFTLKTLHKQITAMGKVKWIKIIIDDESYEAGVEFVNTPDEAIRKLADYISWKQKNTTLKPV